MLWYHYVSFFFGSLIFTNAIPHLVSGLMGRPFQSPFARPPGVGLSSSRVNVLWGWFNLALAYLLLLRVGELDLRNTQHFVVVGLAGVLGSAWMSQRFGRFHGGNDPH